MGKYPALDLDTMNTSDVLAVIDHTLLKPDATLESYTKAIAEARQWGFNSVFVAPCYVPLASGMLSATEVKVGVPLAFPFGYAAPEIKAAEALAALEEGALEADMVMNITAARSGEWEIVEEDIATVVKAIREWEKLTLRGPVITKLILETAYLDYKQKREACRRAVIGGLDYVKTATGFGPGGATVDDIRLMREVVGDDLGVKAAGGIRTWADAKAMIEAGATRIGTSAGPAVIEDFVRAAT